MNTNVLSLKRIGKTDVPSEQYNDVLQMHGAFYKPSEIRTKIIERYGKDSYFNHPAHITNVCDKPENRLMIQRFRNNYLKKIQNIPIMHKIVRLRHMQAIVDRLADEIETKTDVDQEFRENAKSLRETLIAAKNEIEGAGVNFNQINVIGDMDEKSDDDLRAIRDELIKKARASLVERRDAGSLIVGGTADDNGSVIEAQTT